MAHIHAPRLKPYPTLSFSSTFIKHHAPLWPWLDFHNQSIQHLDNCDHSGLPVLFLPRVLTFLLIGFLESWNPFNHQFLMTHIWSWCIPPHWTIFYLVGQPLVSLPCHFLCLIHVIWHVINHYIFHITFHVIKISYRCHCPFIESLGFQCSLRSFVVTILHPPSQ